MSASEGVAVLAQKEHQREVGNLALSWSALRDTKSKRGEGSSVGGDRAPSDLVL